MMINKHHADTIDTKISFIASMIRENRIEHARLSKELNELLKEFEQ